MGICCTTPEFRPPSIRRKPLVRMCSSGNHFSNFADIGDTVVLFVDFGKLLKPLPRRNQEHSLGGATAGKVWPDQRHRDPEKEQYEIKLAGLQAFLKKIKPKDENCTSFRAQAKLLMTDDVLRNPGGLVKFVVPYCNSEGESLGVVTEEDIEYDPNHRVYNHPLWDELIVHNEDVRKELKHRTSSRLVETTYGAVGQQRRSLKESVAATDQVDGANASVEVLTATDEHDPLLGSHPPERYWPDSWEMSCWQPCCDPIMRSRNWFTRFWAMFFVTPLTNVTGLSLYYQLYLVEIFHIKFATKLGHYIFMPLIVMMMLTFFAQWRFLGCYTLANTEVFVLNGTAVLAYILFFWYTLWGLIQKTPCMGLFMIGPLVVMYILANITFQMAVKNSSSESLNCTECWNYTNHSSGHVKYFSAFKLIHWYYNPVLWVIVLCFCQALSHSFEPKLPPRVNQTAHWMSCADMFKKFGYRKSFVIFLLQAVFGTIDELLASPRLLPLLTLRICFNIGYSPKEWEVLKILVEKSLQFGDPALDYIGSGGAAYLPEDSVIPVNVLFMSALPNVTSLDTISKYLGNLDVEVGTLKFNFSRGKEVSITDTDATGETLDTCTNIGYNIGKLKKHLKEMESVLTDEQRKMLSDPHALECGVDDWLEHYIVVRHYVAKYELQVHAYGPFRTNKQNAHVENDDKRMDRDFPIKEHRSFRNFLNQVRFHLWMMEDEMITKRAASACCANEL